MPTSRRTFLSSIPILAAGTASTFSANEDASPAPLKSIEEVKNNLVKSYDPPAGIGLASNDWKEATFQERKLLFCVAVLSSFGESYIDVHGWIYREYLKAWQPFLLAKTHSLGKAQWEIDSKKGILSVRGAANNEVNGVEVLRFDLRVA